MSATSSEYVILCVKPGKVISVKMNIINKLKHRKCLQRVHYTMEWRPLYWRVDNRMYYNFIGKTGIYPKSVCPHSHIKSKKKIL